MFRVKWLMYPCTKSVWFPRFLPQCRRFQIVWCLLVFVQTPFCLFLSCFSPFSPSFWCLLVQLFSTSSPDLLPQHAAILHNLNPATMPIGLGPGNAVLRSAALAASMVYGTNDAFPLPSCHHLQTRLLARVSVHPPVWFISRHWIILLPVSTSDFL